MLHRDHDPESPTALAHTRKEADHAA